MKIGELARRSGLAASTIRFYESKGLLKAVSRQTNGYRDYPLEAVAVLSIIANAQQTGFTLDEIRQILPQDIAHWQHEELLVALRKKVQDIESMEVRLAQNKRSAAMLTGRQRGLDGAVATLAAQHRQPPGLLGQEQAGGAPVRAQGDAAQILQGAIGLDV